MLNEPFHKLVQSLAGIYRSYYELCAIDESFKDKCQIFIIADGYENLSEDFLMEIECSGIYNEFKTTPYRSVRIDPGTNKNKHYYKDLLFMNKRNMSMGK